MPQLTLIITLCTPAFDLKVCVVVANRSKIRHKVNTQYVVPKPCKSLLEMAWGNNMPNAKFM